MQPENQQSPQNQPQQWFAAPNIPTPLPPLQQEKPKRSKVIAIIAFTVALIIVAIIAVYMVIASQRYNLEPMTYDNGLGQKYQMDFYKEYTSVNPTDEDPENEGMANQLVAGVVRGDTAPLRVEVATTTELDETLAAEYNNLLTCKDEVAKAFTVRNNYIGKDIAVCTAFRPGDKDAVYIGTYEREGVWTTIAISHDITQDELYEDGEVFAEQGYVDLQLYQEDIKRIIASLRTIK